MILRGQDAINRWRWPHFTPDEFKCKHCGEIVVDDQLMDKLEEIRVAYARPMRINSGYRCSEYNSERFKTGPRGPHTLGAVDIGAYGADAHMILKLAFFMGVPRIGVNQKGPKGGRFIHLDMVHDFEHPTPTVWSY